MRRFERHHSNLSTVAKLPYNSVDKTNIPAISRGWRGCVMNPKSTVRRRLKQVKLQIRVDSALCSTFRSFTYAENEVYLKGGVHILAHVHESKCFFSLSYQLYGLKNPTHMYFSNHIL